MKYTILLFYMIFTIISPCVYAQVSAPNLISQHQLDSLYHYQMSTKYADYQAWKIGLPQRKKKAVIKGAVGGIIIGTLVGLMISGLEKGGCEVISATIAPLAGIKEESACKSKAASGALIGGGLGLIIGIGAGQEKARRLRFRPKRY